MINGTVAANGGDLGTDTQAGGGAGGGIYITCTSIAGNATGLLTVKGDNGGSYFAGGAGGGGGRIAVWVDVPANIRNRYILSNGGDGRAVVARTNLPPAFSGAILITNGTGSAYSPPSTNAAYPGALFFFSYVKGARLGI